MTKDTYESLKVEKGTVKLLRLLSFHLDIPMTRLVKELAQLRIKQLGITITGAKS